MRWNLWYGFLANITWFALMSMLSFRKNYLSLLFLDSQLQSLPSQFAGVTCKRLRDLFYRGQTQQTQGTANELFRSRSTYMAEVMRLRRLASCLITAAESSHCFLPPCRFISTFHIVLRLRAYG